MNSEHYKINQLFMSWIGQWPEQSKFNRFFLSINVIVAIGSQLCIQICGLVAVWQDWDLVIEIAPPIFIHIKFFIQFFNCLFNTRKIESLLAQMRSSWNLATYDNQIQILKAYTVEGKRLIKAYIVLMYGSMFLYITLPIAESLMIFFTNANQTYTYGLLYNVKAALDVEKYYYFILLHSYYTTIFLMTIPIATDSMLITYVQHACGLFAAIGHQLENVKRNSNININIWPLRKDDKHYCSISESAAKHREVLQFAELLGSTYSICLLVLTILNVTIITLSGVETVIAMDRPLEAFRFGIATTCLTVHFLFLSMPGQKLIDHSTGIYQSICAAKWYAISLRARKLLNVMLMRCKKPCQLTVGKMCVMSLQTFSKVIRASMSYFTLLISLR